MWRLRRILYRSATFPHSRPFTRHIWRRQNSIKKQRQSHPKTAVVFMRGKNLRAGRRLLLPFSFLVRFLHLIPRRVESGNKEEP